MESVFKVARLAVACRNEERVLWEVIQCGEKPNLSGVRYLVHFLDPDHSVAVGVKAPEMEASFKLGRLLNLEPGAVELFRRPLIDLDLIENPIYEGALSNPRFPEEKDLERSPIGQLEEVTQHEGRLAGGSDELFRGVWFVAARKGIHRGLIS